MRASAHEDTSTRAAVGGYGGLVKPQRACSVMFNSWGVRAVVYYAQISTMWRTGGSQHRSNGLVPRTHATAPWRPVSASRLLGWAL